MNGASHSDKTPPKAASQRTLTHYVLSALLLIGGGVLWAHCFAPTYSDCAFRCAESAPRCPAEYECRSDGYCHLPTSTNSCVFGVDIGVPTFDLSAHD